MRGQTRQAPAEKAATHVPASVRSAGPHPAKLAVASALVLWCAFPPAGWGWLAWVALAPLCLLVRSNRSGWALFGGSWLGGFVFWLLAINWVRLSEPGTAWLAWLVMSLVLSFWWPAFVFLARVAVRRLQWPMMLAVPVVWVALEYARAYALTGFPWYYLAHSQYLYAPVIQIADFTGSLGISFVIAMANACWAELTDPDGLGTATRRLQLGRRQVVGLAALGLALGGTLGYGVYRLGTAHFHPGPRVALLQSDIQQVYNNKMGLSIEQVVAVYRKLIDDSLATKLEPPELIVWPETSYPYGFVQLDPLLDQEQFLQQIKSIHPGGTVQFWLTKMQNVSQQLHGWTDQTGIPMVVGALLYDYSRNGLSRFNAAILFEPGVASVQTYSKLKLVPFGEYVPLVDMFPWLTVLTPYRGETIPSLAFGTAPRWFDFKGYRLAVAICFEDTIPQVTRRFFAEAPDGRKPDLLLNLSNDGWFHWSEELEMHLAVSVFRAVENRVPLARAVNTGISALIDGNGRIQARLPRRTQQVLVGVAMLDDRVAMYTFWGDWLGQACLVATTTALLLGIAKAVAGRRRGPAAGSLPKAR
jgi:apolipoprotein N-acyltransferase